ncbi:type IV secretory system conjugative DNA transfer family protein [Niallia taxi]|uniref:type IV secretory system conjugative DNA transfer family protein n=1 Tax=Niallia taxi TaxID=2499688 RepID=UPI003D2B96C1
MFNWRVNPRLPVISISIIGVLSLYLSIRSIVNYLFVMVGQFTGSIASFVLFGNTMYPGFIGFSISTIILIVGWLISTKYQKFQTPTWRLIWFWNMFLGISFYYLWLITMPVYNTLIPYLGNLIEKLQVDNIWFAVAVGDINTLFITIIFTPSVVTGMILMWLSGQYSQYSEDIKTAFYEFEYKNSLLQKWFRKSDTEQWPDVVLGPDSETKELIIQPGRDRTLNNIIIGSIGTGKTAALLLPIINQDLHWMTKFINDYPKISKLENYDSEDVRGKYLNSISIIEPSNDLCQKAYQLVQAHGIPEESVFYIDPTNENTPSINPMQGPVDQVAEAFAMVIEGLAEGGGNDFFKQSERNHLKNYIYLLKLYNPEKEVTFDLLLRMYDNPQLVRQMHLELKDTIPPDFDLIENRDERNHWAIVKQIDEWFDMNHIPKVFRVAGNAVAEKVAHGEYRGQDVYVDAQGEYVKGLRNTLNDIGSNILIRRVLFGKSNFSFDEHLEKGGILLVNTAKGELAGLSNILGKLILLSLQNAVFRRKPNTSTFAHIIADEFPDYIFQPFKEFPAQSRKYKAIVTVVAQTITQLADKYGETYMQTLLGTLRHKMVYGDIPSYDAKLFSEIFGENEKFEEGKNEQAVSPLQEQPMLRTGSSYQKKKEPILSPSDIIYQKAFQAAIKIVVNNKPVPVRQIDANFVPRAEFKEAVVKVLPENGDIWLEERRIAKETDSQLIQQGIEEVTAAPPDLMEEKKKEKLEEDVIKFSVNPSGAPEQKPTFKSYGINNNSNLSNSDIKNQITILEPLSSEPNETVPLNNSELLTKEEKANDHDKNSAKIEEFDLGSLFNKQMDITETELQEKKEVKQSKLGDEELALIKELQSEINQVKKEEKSSSSPLDGFIQPFDS